jgi:hypothetical protein
MKAIYRRPCGRTHTHPMPQYPVPCTIFPEPCLLLQTRQVVRYTRFERDQEGFTGDVQATPNASSLSPFSLPLILSVAPPLSPCFPLSLTTSVIVTRHTVALSTTGDHCWSTLCRDTAQASPHPKPRTYIPGCSLSRGAGRRRGRTTTETGRLSSLQEESRREEGQLLGKIRIDHRYWLTGLQLPTRVLKWPSQTVDSHSPSPPTTPLVHMSPM